MQKKLRFLFFLVHPAKFHFHKAQINELKKRGHRVDIIITKKDILEELVKGEGWEYTNIFPEGRKIKGIHVYLAAFISLIKTISRLLSYTKGKKYDLFIGDLLTWIGLIKRVKTLYPTDDVLNQVPEQVIFLLPSTHPIAPRITDLKFFNKKTIKYNGYKALAHLHPNQFKPDKNILYQNIQNTEYYLIRCTGFFATHDIGRSGISNELLCKLVEILKEHGKILITSERELPSELERYNLNIKKNDIAHYIYYAQLFISDSTTMSTEAAVLGTPSVEFDDYFHEIEQMIELQNKYKLIHCFRTSQENEFLKKVMDLVDTENLKQIYIERKKKLLEDCIDLSPFLVWFYENYPMSKKEYFRNPSIQNNRTYEKERKRV